MPEPNAIEVLEKILKEIRLLNDNILSLKDAKQETNNFNITHSNGDHEKWIREDFIPLCENYLSREKSNA